jgi:hypothetical protein
MLKFSTLKDVSKKEGEKIKSVKVNEASFLEWSRIFFKC